MCSICRPRAINGVLQDLEKFSCASYPKTPSEKLFLQGVVCKHPLFMHLKPAQIVNIVGAFKKMKCNRCFAEHAHVL